MDDSTRMDKVDGEAELFDDVACFVLVAAITPGDDFREGFG